MKVLFNKAFEAYNNENWLAAIRLFEESVKAFYAEHKLCLVECDDLFDSRQLAHFHQQYSASPNLETLLYGWCMPPRVWPVFTNR